ncbi:MAG TPA: hypothetical protein VNK95_15415 [Caldilineaceae bacterium]|nr:hypothetical protein [Caldilineaceae bacterium]
MPDNYTLTRDPVFYGAVACFALLTTALPALLGQPRFLPFIQALCLTIFMAQGLRHGHLRGAINTVALWLALQFILLMLLSRLFVGLVERAIGDGFAYRGAVAAWFFSGGPLPGGLLAAPLGRLAEVVGIVVGSLVSAGLIGAWVLVRATNLAAYGAGTLLSTIETPGLYILALPLWAMIRIAGYAGLVILGAEPLLTNNWSPRFYWAERRRLLLVGLGLVAAGLLLEIVLPPLWSRG